MQLQGWIRPILEFEWDDIQFTDKVTHTTFGSKSKIAVPWYEGWKLRKMLQHKVKINPVFNVNGEIVRIRIKQKGEEEVQRH